MSIFERIFAIFGILTFGLVPLVNGDVGSPPPAGGPELRLTDDQRVCLESKLGIPGQGNPPSYEEMKAAGLSCGITQMPPPPPVGPRIDLTNEQKSCLDGSLGKPRQGVLPSRQDIEAAMSSCGILKPDASPLQNDNESKDSENQSGASSN
jgi:hypothetical protein